MSASPRQMTSEATNDHALPDQLHTGSGLSPPTSSLSSADACFMRRWYRRFRARLSYKGIDSLDNRYGRRFTLGERVADVVSQTMGSWRFVIVQSLFLLAWLAINALVKWAWDAYPFILLNLMLSFQAAYTAPIIMMSQNRQADIDRVKASDLHEKVDHIRLQQVTTYTATHTAATASATAATTARHLTSLSLFATAILVPGVGHLGPADRHAAATECDQAGRG